MCLESLLRDGIVKTNDRLRLRFKCKAFFTTVGTFGTLNGIYDMDMSQLSSTKFETLSDWVTACISEFSEHIPQRVSPLKRVYHMPSKLNISALKKIHALFSKSEVSTDTLRLLLSDFFTYARYLENRLKEHSIFFQKSTIFEKALYCHDKELEKTKINESKICDLELGPDSLVR